MMRGLQKPQGLSSPPPVAQLDRVVASEAIGHRFESCRAGHINSVYTGIINVIYYV